MKTINVKFTDGSISEIEAVSSVTIFTKWFSSAFDLSCSAAASEDVAERMKLIVRFLIQHSAQIEKIEFK